LDIKFGFNDKTLRQFGYQKLGLFNIMKQINTVAFQLKILNSMKIHPMFHVSCFIIRALPNSTIPRRTQRPTPPIVVNGEQKYEVNEILNSRISHRYLQYLIHWQGYDISERLWKLVENLLNAMEKMKNFHM
jgi:hypothetical protein